MPAKKRRRLEKEQKQNRREKRRRVISGLTSRGEDVFTELEKIVKGGFVGSPYPSVNSYITGKLSSGGRSPYSAQSNLPETSGDRYAVGMLTKVKRDFIGSAGRIAAPGEEVHVGFAHPSQIKVISVKINPLVSEAEEAKRKEFYRKRFPKQRIVFE